MVDVDGLHAFESLTTVEGGSDAGRRARSRRWWSALRLAVDASKGMPVLLRRASWRDRVLMLRAFVVLWRVETYLGSGRAAVLLRRLRAHPVLGRRHPRRDEARVIADQVVWAVTSVSICFPASRCLATASSGFLLLRRAGVDVDLVVGATFDKAGKLASHAWLELDGEILLENPMKGRIYRPVVRCSAASPVRASPA